MSPPTRQVDQRQLMGVGRALPGFRTLTGVIITPNTRATDYPVIHAQCECENSKVKNLWRKLERDDGRGWSLILVQCQNTQRFNNKKRCTLFPEPADSELNAFPEITELIQPAIARYRLLRAKVSK